MSGTQDVIQLPMRIVDTSDPEMLSIGLNRNFTEIERMLGVLQGYVKQATGGAISLLSGQARVWDRASNINPDGTFDTSKLTEKLVGLTNELQLADRAVTEAKLAVEAVTENKIAQNAVSEAKIKDAAVTALKIATGAVEIAKFASGLRPVQIVDSLPALPNDNYPQGAVIFLTTENKLYRCTGTAWVASVATTDLTDKMVGLNHELQLADQAVTAAKIAVSAINTLHIRDGAVPVVKTNFPHHQIF